MSLKRKRQPEQLPFSAPSVPLVARRRSIDRFHSELIRSLEAVEWYNKHIPATLLPERGNVWEMMHNYDENLDVRNLFDDLDKHPNLDAVLRKITPVFKNVDSYRISQIAGQELLKLIPATPEIRTAFVNLHHYWYCYDHSKCKNKYRASAGHPAVIFLRLIDKCNLIVRLAALAKNSA